MNTLTKPMPETAAAYIQATNSHDAAAFMALFADNAVVNDAGHSYRGLAEINSWSNREIFDAQVSLDVMDVADHDGQTVVTTKVDGNFDRTGLPDPVIINHQLTMKDNKIIGLKCQLAG